MASFGEEQYPPLNGPARMFDDREKEAERRFEKYAARALTWLGEQLSARGLVLTIWDYQQDRVVFHAQVSRNGGDWTFRVEDPEGSQRRHELRTRSRPTFCLRSQFCYFLNLPHRWSGMTTIEFPGITIVSSENDVRIRNALQDVSKDVTAMLLSGEVARLERCLTEERKQADETRTFMANLSKELYCVSSISTALIQSFNVEKVLARVLEHMLPLLGARLGVIYFLETGQCVSFHSPRSQTNHKEDPWFRHYFQAKMRSGSQGAERNVFQARSLNDNPHLPEGLQAYLESQGIDSVLEFALHCREEFLGLGMLGLRKNQHRQASTRLLMIALNMIGLFLEHIALMGDLDRQVKVISQENLEIEKRNRFLMDYMGTPLAGNRMGSRRVSPTDRLLDEMERSRNTALLAELASGVAHQIRNPLSNLLYALHLLRQEGVAETEKRDIIDCATERVEIINRTITQFIQYTRIPELKLSPESINQVLKNTLRLFDGWMGFRNIELETFFDPQLSLTKIDIFLINQAFHDIVKNAMEAMPDFGHLRVATRKLKIRHGPEPRLEFAEIIFEDNGPGIAPGDLDKVLKPFYSRKEDGLGLGLALVDHIIRAHGGAITLENRHSGGTRVKLYLPIR